MSGVNVLAICLSFAALVVSSTLAIRQQTLQKKSNFLSGYLMLLNEFRTGDFHDRYLYVCNHLRHDHDPDLGISGLPKEARDAIYDVAYFFQGLAVLQRLNILDPRILASVDDRSTRVWQAIADYVRSERELFGEARSSPFRTLEDHVREISAGR